MANISLVGRCAILFACIVGVLQQGFYLNFPAIYKHFDIYGFSEDQSDQLYGVWLNLGGTMLSFIPGIIYDRYGAIVAVSLAAALGLAGRIWEIAQPPGEASFTGFALCYVAIGYGIASNLIVPVLLPLKVFEKKHIGKISALVQIGVGGCVQVQSLATVIVGMGATSVFGALRAYFLYALAYIIFSWMLIFTVLWTYRKALQEPVSEATPERTFSMPELTMNAPPGQTHFDPVLGEVLQGSFHGVAHATSTVMPADPRPMQNKLAALVLNRSFLAMAIYALVVMGLMLAFHAVMFGKLLALAEADAMHMSGQKFTLQFALFNIAGRLLVNLPQDYTRSMRYGGPWAYAAVSILCFMVGLLILGIFGSGNQGNFFSWHVEGIVMACNCFSGLGYGGISGAIPSLLQVQFDPKSLGLIYGLLYGLSALTIYPWQLAASNLGPEECLGAARDLACYGTFAFFGSGCLFLVFLMSIAMLFRSEKDAQNQANRQ